MTTLYKLTDIDGYTRRGQSGETLWAPGVVVTATGKGGLCSPGVVHAYRHPELGLAMNPIHAEIVAPRAWMCEGEVIEDDGTKVGCRSLRCVAELEVDHAAITPAALVRWAIYLALDALEVGAIPAWESWAEGWLSGADRSAAGAEAPAEAARAAAAWAEAAAEAAARAAEAAWAAEAAARAAAAWAAGAGAWTDDAQALLFQAIGEEAAR